VSLLPEVERELLRVARKPLPGPFTRAGILTAIFAAVSIVVAGWVLISLHESKPAPPARPATGFPDAPHSQRYGRGPCPIAPRNRYLPPGAGCVTSRLADVDGDGRPDLVLLFAKPGRPGPADVFYLKVVRARGGSVLYRVGDQSFPIRLVLLANANDRPGVELFLHQGHNTSYESMGVYTFSGRALRRAGELHFDGTDFGLRYGFTCHASPPATIVQHEFKEQFPAPGPWTRRDTTYAWVGDRLQASGTHTFQIRGSPPVRQIGAHC
jgi:hypothetical protein